MPGTVRYALDILTEGPYAAATARLDALVERGVSIVELTPPPGPPSGEELRAFVAAAHARRVGVVLGLAAPGLAVDDAVRWLTRYDLDGLRLESAPSSVDEIDPKLPATLADALATLAGHLGRPLTLSARTDESGRRFLVPAGGGPLGTLGGIATWLGVPVPPQSPGLRAVAATVLMTAPLTPVLRAGEDDLAPLYGRLAALRRDHPELADPRPGPTPPRRGGETVMGRRGSIVVAANLGAEPQRVSLHAVPRRVLLSTADGVSLASAGVDLPPESAVVVACCRLDPL